MIETRVSLTLSTWRTNR